MYYEEDFVEEVRQRSDVVDIISSYVNLKRTGSNYVGLCPFHNEKTASFSVSPSKQMYYCFGCGAGGNVFTFLMEYENYTFPEALEVLANRIGVELPKQELSAEQKRASDKKARLLEANKEAAKYFYTLLRSERGSRAHEYFKNRGLSEKTLQKFGLGYSDKYSDDLYRYLRTKGYEDELLKDSGLVSIDEQRGGYDKFWNRAMFPIMDVRGKVIGFGGRVMGDGEPKYLNSPETMIFDKSRNLYGMNYARSARTGNIILCEGYMDVISMHQAGFTQAVASLGTAFTPGQAALIKKYTKDVLLAYDSDGAGVKAALRAIKILHSAGMSGRIINMTPYKDPDEFIKNLGKEAFQERIDHAENSFMFEIRMLEREFDLNDPEGKTNFYNSIARKLCEFSEDVERENYITAVADKYHIGFDNLRKLVVNTAAKTGGYAPLPERPKSGIQNRNTPEENTKKSQRLLLTWLTDEPQLYFKIKQYITPADFTEELYPKVAERMYQDIENNQLNPAGIINMFADEKEQSEAASLFTTKLPQLESVQEQEKAFKDILISVKRNSYNYYSSRMGVDISALNQVIEGKKALEELSKTHISLN